MSSTSFRLVHILWIALTLVASLAILLTGRSSAGPSTTVSIDPQDQQVPVSGQFALDIRVADATNLGAFQIALSYDSAIVDFDGYEQGEFLASTGRTMLCSSSRVDADSWLLGCASGSPTKIAGPDGSGVLATVLFVCVQAGISSLNFDDVILTDIFATELSRSATGGSVTCSSTLTLLGDVDCNGRIDPIDALWVLQFEAALVNSLACQHNGDTSQDGTISSRDAVLILQFSAGLTPRLP